MALKRTLRLAAGRPCGVPPRTFLWPQRERARAGRTQAPGGKKGKERVEIPLNLMCLCDADLRDIPSLENVISVCFCACLWSKGCWFTSCKYLIIKCEPFVMYIEFNIHVHMLIQTQIKHAIRYRKYLFSEEADLISTSTVSKLSINFMEKNINRNWMWERRKFRNSVYKFLKKHSPELLVISVRVKWL